MRDELPPAARGSASRSNGGPVGVGPAVLPALCQAMHAAAGEETYALLPSDG